jgi:hypothetical protein
MECMTVGRPMPKVRFKQPTPSERNTVVYNAKSVRPL